MSQARLRDAIASMFGFIQHAVTASNTPPEGLNKMKRTDERLRAMLQDLVNNKCPRKIRFRGMQKTASSKIWRSNTVTSTRDEDDGGHIVMQRVHCTGDNKCEDRSQDDHGGRIVEGRLMPKIRRGHLQYRIIARNVKRPIFHRHLRGKEEQESILQDVGRTGTKTTSTHTTDIEGGKVC